MRKTKVYLSNSLFRGVDVDSGESLEGVDRDKGDQGVQLLGGVLVLVALAVKAHTDAVLDITDSALPDGLVQAGVDADILGAHGLAGEGADGLDGLRGPVLEADAVDALET